MKNLHKKIGAVVLAGLVLAGGIGVSGIKVDAAAAKPNKVSKNKFSPQDLKKYKNLVYGVHLPDSDYSRKIPFKSLLNNNNDSRVKRQMQEIKDICDANDKIDVLQMSSEVDKEGANSLPPQKRGINAYLHGLKKAVGKNLKGDASFFEQSQLFFDDVQDFKIYIEEESEKFESGLARVQIENVECVFMIRSGSPEGGGEGK